MLLVINYLKEIIQLSPNKTNMNKFKIKNMKYNGIKTQTTFNKDLSSPKKYLPEINKDK